MTISDKASRGEREDLSGPALREVVEASGYKVVFEKIVPDEKAIITDELRYLIDNRETDLILTTGGTGWSERDVTPEATIAVIEKNVPGIPEMIRAASAKITNRAYLSRAVCGISGKTLIINFPGSPKAVREVWEIISPVLDHGLEILKGETSECAR